MHTNASQENLPLNYFLLVFVLAVPFWLFGDGKLPLPINLPVGALVTFVPVIAASLLSYRRSGFKGVKELLTKALDYQKIRSRIWYLPVLLLMPLIYFLSYVIMRSAGLPLPDAINIPLLLAPVFFIMFLIGDAGEELGWSGYAIDPMQNRWGGLEGQPDFGGHMGALASHPICANWKPSMVDCMAKPLSGGITNSDRLDLQQHRKECSCCHPGA